ncbi:C-GCAxxG-C-C family protein [Ruminococcus sp. OA3]|uniref:C-GCAxxG-C-C family protein n=1 Tax=Ruminococcus sp. OA3 TaxID=2914164 RepID=UPI001F055729|nr:C-GCAxxG-C-C family protein [Ruminococcus sp. OA3]MCH1984405.1 C-GCAxxG-C-C family protein [Ruminococcus sp. OA3]
MNDFIEKKVHELYWERNINCARTMLLCLSELFHMECEPQILHSAIGLHGAGGYRAQCGLVEGGLMFIGIYSSKRGKSEDVIAGECYTYADKFTDKWGSLRCRELRPDGFTPADEPHKCEKLTCEAVRFTYEFIQKISMT